MEDPNLDVTQPDLDFLNSDLERKRQSLTRANQVLRRQIQEKEEHIQSLERDIALSGERAKEMASLNQTIMEKEEALGELDAQTVKLENKNLVLGRNVEGLQKKISRRCKKVGPDEKTLKRLLAEAKVKLQRSTESCTKQKKKMAKVESDYQCVHELCKDQAHYIKKYHEILRQMEHEKKGLLLKKETSKRQNNPSSQAVRPGSALLEITQSNMEETGVKNDKRMSWHRYFWCLFSVIIIFLRLLGYVFFHLHYINPDLLVDSLPMLMSRSNLKWLSDTLLPFLTLEVEDVLPH